MAKFLTAEWRYLLMLNYSVPPGLLKPYVPVGVELDTWNGTTYLSVVGFLFLHTRVLGIRLPFHSDFEEVNLRFYVRRHTANGWRRGVVFIKEIVPRWITATVARVCYNENYISMPMRHSIRIENLQQDEAGSVEYAWRYQGKWQTLSARPSGFPRLAIEGSEEQFITEHYWGYANQRNGECVEYQVEHSPWKIWPVKGARLNSEITSLYGRQFVDILNRPPKSAFLADGSTVTVHAGKKLR